MRWTQLGAVVVAGTLVCGCSGTGGGNSDGGEADGMAGDDGGKADTGTIGADGASAPACSDGVDDDGDGFVDFIAGPPRCHGGTNDGKACGGASDCPGVGAYCQGDVGCASASDDEERVGAGIAVAGMPDIVPSTSASTCGCDEATYADGGTDQTVSGDGRVISNTRYRGYTVIASSSTKFHCVLFEGGYSTLYPGNDEVELNGNDDELECVRVVDMSVYGIYAPNAGGVNTYIHDSLITDTNTNHVCRAGTGVPRSYCTGAGTGWGAGGPALNIAKPGLRVERVEEAHVTGNFSGPAPGDTHVWSGNYLHDWWIHNSLTLASHLEFLWIGGAGGHVDILDNRMKLRDDHDTHVCEAGGGSCASETCNGGSENGHACGTGWSGFVLVQKQSGTPQSSVTIARNQFEAVEADGVTPEPAMTAVNYAFTFDSHDGTACDGAVDLHGNSITSGSSGFVNAGGGPDGTCGLCDPPPGGDGSKKVCGNTRYDGVTALVASDVPGGLCGTCP